MQIGQKYQVLAQIVVQRMAMVAVNHSVAAVDNANVTNAACLNHSAIALKNKDAPSVNLIFNHILIISLQLHTDIIQPHSILMQTNYHIY
jgi:hypothetical protein